MRLGLSNKKDFLAELMLTAKRLGSYPPKILTAASTAISGLMFGIIVSVRVIGEVCNPEKNQAS